MNRAAIVISTLSTALLVTAAGLSLAGPLDPPAGPVAPSYKTLTQVEPRTPISVSTTPGDADSAYKITQPGSYYLTGNILGVSGKHGIEITASGVTIDLGGFDVQGVVGAGSGIWCGELLSSITIRNGSLRNWPGSGVSCTNAAAIRLADLAASGNSVGGFSAGTGASITGCTAQSNTGVGFDLGSGSSITACSSNLNGQYGFRLAIGCLIADCNAYANTLDGIRAFGYSTVRNNNCNTNGLNGDGAGIHVSAGDNRIEGNNCTANDRGMDADNGGNFIVRNTCSSNTINWDIAAANTILVVQATSANLISGNTGGLAPGSTDPNANFTY